MNRLRGFLALLLSRVVRSPAFVSETSIQHTFVRARLAWVKSQLCRGKSVADIAKLLGVQPSVIQHELLMDRACKGLES